MVCKNGIHLLTHHVFILIHVDNQTKMGASPAVTTIHFGGIDLQNKCREKTPHPNNHVVYSSHINLSAKHTSKQTGEIGRQGLPYGMRITGYITRRRCIGKKLAFADIQVEEWSSSVEIDNFNLQQSPTLHPKADTVQVIFHRGSDHSVWNDLKHTDKDHQSEQDHDNHPFPSKNTALPYGAFVSLVVVRESMMTATSSSIAPDPDNESYHVKSWKILVHPREEAIKGAKHTEGNEGISCSDYLRARGDAYLRFNGDQPNYTTKKSVADGNPLSSGCPPSFIANNPGERNEGEFFHGDNRAKSLRAKIFCSWLIHAYGRDFLATAGGGRGVLDIAGGKGKLSIELALQGKIQSTIVDPVIRKHGENLEPRFAKKIRRIGAPHPRLLPREFNQTTYLKECEDSIAQCSILVGLHPDECTEDILDVALRHRKPVAVVPCCVFTGFFPLRCLPSRNPVRTYEEFLEYLLLKDDRLRRHELPFQGRNVVIYMAPSVIT